MTYLIYALGFIFILGSAVVLHEFGHFIVAKLFKIRVETFSVGFGPRLFGKKWGHTDYRVSAIPLGGYVKLGGDESNAPLEGASAQDIPPKEMYNLRPRWQRIMVALAGPIMNILTAMAIPFVGAFMYGVPATPSPVVYYVQKDGAAAQAGLQPGDRIISFNGTENPTWDVINGDALLSPGRPLPVVVNRNGQEVSLTVTPTTHMENGEAAGTLDFIPDYGGLPVVVVQVNQGSPAEAVGLKENDRFISIDGQDVRSSAQVTEYVRNHPAERIAMTVQRDGQTVQLTTDDKRIDGRLGFVVMERYPLHAANIGSATKYAYDQNIQILRLTGKALGQVFTGQRSVRNTLSGPIGIYQATQKSIEKMGWDGVFGMLGFLSLNLGIFNLLPIPVLDGGAIFLMLIEGLLALIGLSISSAVRDRIQQVGFVMVLLLMVFVISNDLLKTFGGNRQEEKPPPAASAPAK
ncbi:MAG TPA: RIP metalloprotease RseP [Pyrinomonadaceae bacterium]|jgi:regulator of sigma E protease|nr:RIP metalloprotease RseP [Pyrinomonadaceae bacterium]